MQSVEFTDTTTIVDWDPIPTADRYEHWFTLVGFSGTGRASGHNDPITTDSRFEGSRVGSSGAHILDSLTFSGARRRVWIRAGNDDGFGPWGPATDFILPGTPEDTPVLNVTRNSFYGGAAPPEVTAPIQNEAPTRPEITWSAGVPGVPYQLWVQNENGVLINQSAITGTSFTPDNDLADGVYSAWVRQLPANGQPLPWSSRYQFAVGQSSLPEVPVLGFTPSLNGDAVEDRRAIFTWDAAANATRYELFISQSRTGNLVLRKDDITATNVTTEALSNVGEGGRYRAWLRSIGPNGEESQWSEFVPISIHSDTGEVFLD